MANQRVILHRHTLGELLDVTRGMSLPGSNYATSGKLIRLTLGNFDYGGNGFKENTSKDNIYYSGKVPEAFILNVGDIITPLTEQTPGLLGTTARIPQSGKYIQSQDVALITCKPDKLDPLFCYYLVSSSIVKQQLALLDIDANQEENNIRNKDITITKKFEDNRIDNIYENGKILSKDEMFETKDTQISIGESIKDTANTQKNSDNQKNFKRKIQRMN